MPYWKLTEDFKDLRSEPARWTPLPKRAPDAPNNCAMGWVRKCSVEPGVHVIIMYNNLLVLVVF